MTVLVFILGGVFAVTLLYAGMRIEQSRKPRFITYSISLPAAPEIYTRKGQHVWTKA